MLSGMLPVTEGTAKVFGLDICEEMPQIRNMMAVCPQFDILWDNLTGMSLLLASPSSEGASVHCSKTPERSRSADSRENQESCVRRGSDGEAEQVQQDAVGRSGSRGFGECCVEAQAVGGDGTDR